ncbi:MAG: formate hydrogenlyase, partial [Nitrospira sp.]|nr:formate hydrogenlyase [Nitrospira sp.]
WGIAAAGDVTAIPVAAGLLILKLFFAGVGLVLVETGLAKMRLFRVQEFLGSAFLFATLGLLSYFMLE